MAVVHFNSSQERLKYLRGDFEEIVPVIAEEEPEKVEEKPKKTRKRAKKDKKEDENGEVQAE